MFSSLSKGLAALGVLLLIAVITVPARAQDSLNVSLKGSLYHHWDYACDVEVVGDYAYVATGESGLSIMDITDPSSPVELGFYPTLGSVTGVAVSGNCAYVLSWTWGGVDVSGGYCDLVDISDPTAPVQLARFSSYYAYDVAVQGNYVYIAAGYYIAIYDISDPTNPTLVTEYGAWNDYRALEIDGSYAYATYRDFNQCYFEVVDISDPITPVGIGTCAIPYGWHFDIMVSGNYAYVAHDECGLRIIDVSNPDDPNEVGFLDTPGHAYGVSVQANFAYVADFEEGLRIIDVSDPTIPAEITSMVVTGEARAVTVVDSDLYLTCGNHGLRLIDVSEPAEPEEVWQHEDFRRVIDVVYEDNYVYVAEGSGNRMSVISVSDPSEPEEVGSCTFPDSVKAVDVEGDYAYVVLCNGGLYVIDVTDQTNPTHIGFCDTPEMITDVDVANEFAFVTESHEWNMEQGGLRIIDLSDPTAPVDVEYFDLASNAKCVTVVDNFAYVVAGYLLHVIDISNPSLPVEFGSCGGRGTIAVEGEYAYNFGYAGRQYGLSVIDISNPAWPTFVSFLYFGCMYDFPGGSEKVAVRGDYVFLANHHDGICVVDVSDPEAPEVVGFHDSPGIACGVAVNGDYAYVADKYCFQVFDCSAALIPPLIDIDLYPDVSALYQGEVFTYDAVLISHLPATYNIDVWTYVDLPNGNLYGPIWRVENYPLFPNTSIRAEGISQSVPIYAPMGFYSFHMNAGIFPNIVVGEDEFEFLVWPVEGSIPSDNASWTGWGYETAFNQNVGSDVLNQPLPIDYSLCNAYPNPFNASTTITLTLPETVDLTVAIYNVTGQLVATLMNGNMNAGLHRMTFDGSELSGGMYFVKATTHNWEAVQKIVLLK